MCSIWDLMRDTDEGCKGFEVLGMSVLGHCVPFGTAYMEEEGKRAFGKRKSHPFTRKSHQFQEGRTPSARNVLEMLDKDLSQDVFPIGSCLAKGEEQGIS